MATKLPAPFHVNSYFFQICFQWKSAHLHTTPVLYCMHRIQTEYAKIFYWKWIINDIIASQRTKGFMCLNWCGCIFAVFPFTPPPPTHTHMLPIPIYFISVFTRTNGKSQRHREKRYALNMPRGRSVHSENIQFAIIPGLWVAPAAGKGQLSFGNIFSLCYFYRFAIILSRFWNSCCFLQGTGSQYRF